MSTVGRSDIGCSPGGGVLDRSAAEPARASPPAANVAAAAPSTRRRVGVVFMGIMVSLPSVACSDRADCDTDAAAEETGRRGHVPPTVPLVRISAAT
jgi:hypothetical protein